MFGEFAKHLSALISEQDPDLPIVLIVQFGKINEYRDELSVTNAFNGTKIFVNEDIKEIKEFTQSYHGWAPIVNTQGCTSQSVGSLGSPSDFFKECQHVALSDITDSDKGWYVSYASIDSIHHEDNWFYSACKKCNRKVVPLSQSELAKGNVGNGLKCPGCGPNPQSLYPKYKVNVRVVNDTGSASLTLFDRHVKELLGISAYDLRKKYIADDDIPEELDEIVGRQFLYKFENSPFNIEEFYYIYTVGEMTDDEDIIQIFKHTYHIDDDSADDNINMATDDASQSFVSVKDVVSVTDENCGIVDLTMSTADSPHGKRKANTITDAELTSVKSSSTKAKKRLVAIKIEKE